MSQSQPPTGNVLDRLREDRPLVSVELRPPRSDMSQADSMERWIDMYHSIQRLTRRDTVVFLTDNAVGQAEEENLAHITANIGVDADRAKIIPFLTCKHTMDYSLLYAQRAASSGFDALTVLGGDNSVGPPRCVEHAYQLRQSIRARVPNLRLGGWANPHRDAEEQVRFLLESNFSGEFYLTQVVSHHSIDQVERFVTVARREGVPFPGVFGVFFYRSANPKTLSRLNDFFPVPAEGVTRDFEAGLSPLEICCRSIQALRDVGADKVYVSNLGFSRVDAHYRSIMTALEA
jgi:5,10-methylenetetrahydrofolate reductase